MKEGKKEGRRKEERGRGSKERKGERKQSEIEPVSLLNILRSKD